MANTAITLLMELQGQKKSLTQSSPAFPYAHPLILITIFFFFAYSVHTILHGVCVGRITIEHFSKVRFLTIS